MVRTSVADTGPEDMSAARDLRKQLRRVVALMCLELFRLFPEALSIRWVCGSSVTALVGPSCR